jgi:hypothetical protein
MTSRYRRYAIDSGCHTHQARSSNMSQPHLSERMRVAMQCVAKDPTAEMSPPCPSPTSIRIHPVDDRERGER